ncbi:MAG: DUF4339 domain-containing protein [Proteobacteria bacterium]|nr:DUF4339 domain-containing protein [Pseudomonadota bacterium]
MSASRGDVLWYVRRGERVLGPFQAVEIAAHAKASTLLASDLLWCQGLEQWVPAGVVPGLLPARQPAPASRSIAPNSNRAGSALPHYATPRAGLSRANAGLPSRPTEPAARPSTAAAFVSSLAPLPAGAPAYEASEPSLHASGADEASSLKDRAIKTAQSLLSWSTAQIAGAAAKLGGTASLEQIRDQFQALRWSETFESALTRAAQRIDAPTLGALLDDAHTRQLASLLLDAMPTVGRLAITLTIGAAGFEAALLALRNRLRERLPPAELNAPLSRALPSLINSDAFRHQSRILAERIRHEVVVTLVRKIDDPSGAPTAPIGRRFAS